MYDVLDQFFTKLFLSQVVERLLGLPVEYWSQFMISNNDQAHNNHMIIENPNVHATPDQKSMNFTSKHLTKLFPKHHLSDGDIL